MKLISVYGCDYCSMVSRRKGSVARHETYYCRKNPSRKTCANCVNANYELPDMSVGEFGGWCCEKEHDIDQQNMNGNINCIDHELINKAI